MKNLNILSFLFILMLSSCSQPSDEAVEYVDVDGQKVPKIFPEMIKDETEVKFTDWFEDIRLIKLESTEGSLMRYVMRTYVGEEYIIVASPFEGIMIFDSEGKFIRPIAPMGKGPCELNPNDPNRNIFVDEKNNKLYVTELQMNSKNVKCFDIETQECSTIPLVYKGNELGIRDIIVVAGYRREQLIRYLNELDAEVKVAYQNKQLGAADALLCAKSLIKEDFLLLPGDNYIDAESIARIKKEKNSMLVVKHPYPSNYGVVEVEDGYVKGIVEKPAVSGDMTVSTGIFSLTPEIFDYLSFCQIPDVIDMIIKKVTAIKAINAIGWHDSIYPWDLLMLNKVALKTVRSSLAGEMSKSSVMSGVVSVGKGTVISPYAVIKGPAVIGEDTYIGPHTCIMPGTSIGSRVRIEPFTIVENSILMDDSAIGSHSRIIDSVVGEGSVLLDHTSSVSGTYLQNLGDEIVRGPIIPKRRLGFF